ncbi:MAG: peptide chain release factor-like protein, partial [Acholeplasmatales bacterium]
KAEDGVHRLVRISPFDSNKRRHTSFVACLVIPEIEDGGDIEINDEDIRVDVFRSGGAGGQSVNTTDSAVRITHLPTNIVVTCQNERSQIKNREVALNVLKSRLIQLQEKEKSEELASLKGELKAIAWGSQIRSYVFHPYQMVKDHRTNYETSQTDDVMDGDLDAFIDAYLRQVGHDK